MREYKPTYGTSLLYAWASMFLSCASMMILVDLVLAFGGAARLGQVFGGYLLVFCLFGVAGVLFVLLISFFTGIFTNKSVLLSDHSVSYRGKTIPLDKVCHIILYLPKVSKHSSKPQILTIWADNKTYMDIKRPSIPLIAELKRRCPFASFDVDDWKSHLKQILWIQLGMAVFAIVAIIFGFE